MEPVSIPPEHSSETPKIAIANELSFEKRACPSCNMETIKGMRGSMDSICKNCGYKDPCCYD